MAACLYHIIDHMKSLNYLMFIEIESRPLKSFEISLPFTDFSLSVFLLFNLIPYEMFALSLFSCSILQPDFSVQNQNVKIWFYYDSNLNHQATR